MQRTYKPLSLAYLIIATILAFQGKVYVMEGERVGSESSEESREQSTTERTGEKQTPPPAEITGTGEDEPSGSSAEQEPDESGKEGAEVTQLPGKSIIDQLSGAIKVNLSSASFEQVLEVWEKLKTLAENVLTRLQPVIESLLKQLDPVLNPNYKAEQQALDTIWNHANSVVSDISTMLDSINKKTITSENVSTEINRVITASRVFADAVEAFKVRNPTLKENESLEYYQRTVDEAVGKAVRQLDQLFVGQATVK